MYQKRYVSIKRGTYPSNEKCIYQKRYVCIQRDTYLSKKICIYQKRYVSIKRDLYLSKDIYVSLAMVSLMCVVPFGRKYISVVGFF